MNQALSALYAGAFLLAAGLVLSLMRMINLGGLIFLFGLGLLLLQRHVDKRYRRRRKAKWRWFAGDMVKITLLTGTVAGLGWLLLQAGGFGR